MPTGSQRTELSPGNFSFGCAKRFGPESHPPVTMAYTILMLAGVNMISVLETWEWREIFEIGENKSSANGGGYGLTSDRGLCAFKPITITSASANTFKQYQEALSRPALEEVNKRTADVIMERCCGS